MPQKKAVTPWEKEFARLERRRRAYQARHARPPESRLDRALEDKVPPKLREALNSAFVKAFDLVFQRGTGLLERTFDAEAARQQFEIDQFAAQLKGDRSSLRVFSRRAGRTGALNFGSFRGRGHSPGAAGDRPARYPALYRRPAEKPLPNGCPLRLRVGYPGRAVLSGSFWSRAPCPMGRSWPHAPRCWTSLPSPPVRRRTMTRGHRSAGLPLS